MEKQLSNSNFLMLHHLPRIFSMLQVMNMMMYGFVNNQPAYFVLALNTIQKSIRISPKMIFKKWLGKYLQTALRIVYYVALTISVLLVMLTNSSTADALFIIASIALLALSTRLFLIYKCIRLNRNAVRFRNVTVYQGSLKNYSSKWVYYYHQYKIADLLAFVTLFSAVIFD